VYAYFRFCYISLLNTLTDDPEFPSYKANYREFLQQTSRFHQPIPINDEQINRKVHATYRLQFLKDVVLARSIDDSTFNVLSSCIMFNQVDIITYVQNDPSFLDAVISSFCEGNARENGPLRLHLGKTPGTTNGVSPPSDEVGDARRGELVLLVQQLCAMGKNVQLPARLALFRTLVARGMLFLVQWALAQPERDGGVRLVAAAGEVLAALLDHALEACRAHVTAQVEGWRRAVAAGAEDPKSDPETLLYVMCIVMARSRDLAVQSLVGDALKVLLEVPIPGSEIAVSAQLCFLVTASL
jgi:protein phosphatase 4 regulatory subunit 3